MAIAAGLHDNRVGDREEEEQEDLGEGGDSEVGDQSEGAGHTGQQGVGLVGTGSVPLGAVSVQEGVLQGVTGVGLSSPPRNTAYLEEGREGRMENGKSA